MIRYKSVRQFECDECGRVYWPQHDGWPDGWLQAEVTMQATQIFCGWVCLAAWAQKRNEARCWENATTTTGEKVSIGEG